MKDSHDASSVLLSLDSVEISEAESIVIPLQLHTGKGHWLHSTLILISGSAKIIAVTPHYFSSLSDPMEDQAIVWLSFNLDETNPVFPYE